ncbi:hypothetical protein PCE1_004640 [Barthelona sp. PCE]
MTEIATHFLLSTPAGEFKQIMKDLKHIIDDDVLNDAAASAVLTHLTSHMLTVPYDNTSIVLSLQNVVDIADLQFFNSKTKEVVSINPMKMTVVGQRPASDEEIEKFLGDDEIEIENLIEAIRSHIESFYVSTTSGFEVVIDEECVYNVILSGYQYDKQNFHSAKWNAVYRLESNDVGYEITAKYSISSHFFESGNVQMNVNKEKTFIVDLKRTSEDWEERCIKRILDVELAFHNDFIEFYNHIETDVFNQARRRMPIFGSTINWDNIQAYRQ